jgi:hypothetical protein
MVSHVFPPTDGLWLLLFVQRGGLLAGPVHLLVKVLKKLAVFVTARYSLNERFFACVVFPQKRLGNRSGAHFLYDLFDSEHHSGCVLFCHLLSIGTMFVNYQVEKPDIILSFQFSSFVTCCFSIAYFLGTFVALP